MDGDPLFSMRCVIVKAASCGRVREVVLRMCLQKGKVHTSQAGGAGELSAASARARATCMHNIGQFLGACRQLGVPGYSLFQPEDLLDARAPEQVCTEAALTRGHPSTTPDFLS